MWGHNLLRLGLCAVGSTTVCALTPQAVASKNALPRIDHYGRWTLAELGERRALVVDVRGRPGRSQASIVYLLPNDASQGPRDWFVLNLHFRLEIFSDSHQGAVVVGASTNNFAAAQIEVFAQRKRGRAQLAWRSIDIVDGARAGTRPNSTLTMRYRNYLQNRGVAPGKNRLSFYVDAFRRVRVKRLVIYSDSSLEYSNLGPARLGLSVGEAGSAKVGKPFSIPYELRNDGGRPAKRVVVSARPGSSDIIVLGPSSKNWGNIRDKVRGAFRLRAGRAGSFDLAIEVSTSSNRPAVVARINVVRGGSDQQAWWAFLGLAVLIGIVGSLVLYRRHRG